MPMMTDARKAMDRAAAAKARDTSTYLRKMGWVTRPGLKTKAPRIKRAVIKKATKPQAINLDLLIDTRLVDEINCRCRTFVS